jgi:hypothetical protein
MRRGFFWALVWLLAATTPHGAACAQQVSAGDIAVLAGPWFGTWTGGGFEYDAEMALNARADGSVDGSISWLLRAAPPHRREAAQLGARGIECRSRDTARTIPTACWGWIGIG